ncbi:MAG: phenylalanine--tRNA ligase subunit beta [Mizugakiibacter sp.]|uniref:phenylalanine--tRNA ligase subunit beta n=1 Tax=Mizugakiibacter sp. TaxID=1972610 RepID=UPI0031CA9246|nr:phenylalanine--tRNA ligase subunit beta [Xanthomonadaceae bacterium]
MKFSENWLRELVGIPADRATLVERLTMAGLEVESVTALGAGLDGVVVAEIVEARPHPDADRLRVCTVQAGQGTPLQIVCGAPNARAGLKAPLATIGASLPNGIAIKAAKLRGVESQGMLCSARELGLDADASGLLELPADAPVGTPLARYLGLPDASIELKLTPNRPDCLGMVGLAYDVAAQFGSAARPPQVEVAPVAGSARRGIRLEAGADCPRYLGRMIAGIDPAAATPLWLAERLRRAGLRPLGAVVDVTNYVMLELGQPLHAFDDDRLDGDIVVRRARAGETLTLLDGSEAKLDDGFLLIADATQPLALAGVMGGMDSRVTAGTRNVFLESAHFAPPAIMGRARRLGLSSDAAHRFERGVDPELPRLALERATTLLLAIAGGSAGPVCAAERAQDLPTRTAVPLRRARLARVLGVEVADADVARMLAALGMAVEATGDGWRVTPPSRRFDIEREEDLIEEVARIHGYARIPTHVPAGAFALAPESESRLPDAALREQLAARGYQEAICYAFVGADLLKAWQLDAGAVALANPLSADLAVMRTSLLPGLAQALAANRNRQQARVRLFEVGRSFHAGGGAPLETARVAAVACGEAAAEQWGEPARATDFFDLKGDLQSLCALGGAPQAWRFDGEDLPAWLHPGRGARLLRDGRPVGFLGALHPRLARALDLGADAYVFEVELDALAQRRVPRAEAVSRYPTVRRDIAVELAEEVAWGALEATVRAALGEALADLFVFDRYSGPGLGDGRKSVAMGLILQDRSRTLTDEDADRHVARAIVALERDCGAKLRG